MKSKWKVIIGVVTLLAVMLILAVVTPRLAATRDMAKISKPSHPRLYKSSSEVDKLLDKMEFGSIAFNTPTSININDSHQIQLILSLAETVEQLKQSITEEGRKVGANIKVSNRMEARLSGYMFQITAITPEIQAVSKLEQTEWKWEIQPKKEGNHKLHLTLTALLEVDGHNTPRTIKTFDKIIEVNVTIEQEIIRFFKNNWQWLWAALIIPMLGWIWKRKKKVENERLIDNEKS